MGKGYGGVGMETTKDGKWLMLGLEMGVQQVTG